MTARIYCGTYAKYNSGSIAGKWINLEDFAGDKAGFYDACRELHADEADPELMFQDFEGFPRVFYSESGLPDSLFEWLELDENDRELLEAYAGATGYDAGEITIDAARNVFHGVYDSEADAAEEMTTEALASAGAELPDYIVVDWRATWECNLRHDFCTHYMQGRLWVFYNH